MGACSWFCIPVLPRSWHLRNTGNANFIQERGTRTNRNANFAFLDILIGIKDPTEEDLSRVLFL